MRMEGMKVGKGLDIFVTRAGYRYHLVSKVEEPQKDRVMISLIASGNRVFRFLNTDDVEIVYRDGERMWKWEHVKGGITKLEGSDVHYIESKLEGMTYNRRDAFRVPFHKEINISVYTKKTKEEELKEEDAILKNAAGSYISESDEFSGLNLEQYNKQVVEVLLKDLSERGIGFYSKLPLREGAIIVVELTTEMGNMFCKGEIIRSAKGNFGRYSLLYGCEFSQIDKNLGKYIFKLQREVLRKERLGKYNG